MAAVVNVMKLHDLKPKGRRLGLIAGWGRFPVVVADALARQGFQVYCLGVRDHADPSLQQHCHAYQPIGVARLGEAIRFFRRHGIDQATMAGKIHKVLLFQKLYWLKHLPDWQFVKTFYPHFITQTRDRKDDTMLGTIVDAFARHGVHFAPATDFAPELLVKYGQLSGRDFPTDNTRISNLAGSWPARWDGSTSDKAWQSKVERSWPWKRWKAPTNAFVAPASSARPEALPWSK